MGGLHPCNPFIPFQTGALIGQACTTINITASIRVAPVDQDEKNQRITGSYFYPESNVKAPVCATTALRYEESELSDLDCSPALSG